MTDLLDQFTAEYLRSRLSYNPDTGLLTWHPIPINRPEDQRWNARYAGTRAGYPRRPKMHICVKVDAVGLKAHRLIWKMVHGETPTLEIDHIDGNPLNNRLSNLRLATDMQNAQNNGGRKNRKLPKGVTWHKDGSYERFKAGIGFNWKHVHLGYFVDIADAVVARKKAEEKYFGQFARTP